MRRRARDVEFSVDAYTARLIGRENVSKLEGAVLEIVKNAYDADAKNFCLYYSTIVKKTAKQDREGRIHYSEEELIRYMAVSPMMGRRLFPYAENGEHQILLGNRRENRGFSVEKLRSVIQGVMSMALLVLMYTQLDGRFC